jgi:hypothetical protein
VTDAEAAPAEPEAPAAADDVFARLRAEQAEPSEQPDAADEDAAGEPDEAGPPEPTAFSARDEALAPIDKELARRLKRALADEQNEVLDRLRRAKPAGVDDLLPGVDEHAGRWSSVAAEPLAEAAAAGAASLGGAAPAAGTAPLADELARSLTGPLRERIDRSFAAADGNLDDVADRVRALYREWKGQRLADASSHHTAAAYALGAFGALPEGARVRWAVDPLGGPCPDCDDNVLAGSLAKGEEFPTGHTCAPAHPGCRCLVVAAEA